MAGFFTSLWRVTAVLAFGAALAAIAYLTLLWRDHIDPPWLGYLAPPQTETAVKSKPIYSYVLEPDIYIGETVDEDNFELYRLMRYGKVDAQQVASDASATVNILVVDKKTGDNTWLFQGYNRVIIGQEAMLTGRWYYHEPQVDDDVAVQLMVLRVIEGDSNGDGLLTTSDRQTLYVARFQTGSPENFLSADQIYFTRQQGKEFLVSYRDAGVSYFTTFSLPEFKQLTKTVVKDMPQ